MKKIPGTVLIILGVIAALFLVRECGYRAGAADTKARAVDARTDSTVIALRRTIKDSSAVFNRQRDSTGRVIRDLQRRVARPTSPVAAASGGNSSAVVSTPDVRDSLIAALKAGRQQDSLQLLFWRAQVSNRDSLISVLQKARDQWRQRSERRFSCGAGAGLTVSLGGRATAGPTVACVFRF